MIYTQTYTYDNQGLKDIGKWKFGQNWPVAYIIYNDNHAYIGETLDITRRTFQHLQDSDFNIFDKITVITDKIYNKSSIIDLESFLIKYMSADGKYTLKNGNTGISDHNYFNKDIYIDNFMDVWKQLKEIGLVEHSLSAIENSNLFKYSPYKSLGDEQYMVAAEIINLIRN